MKQKPRVLGYLALLPVAVLLGCAVTRVSAPSRQNMKAAPARANPVTPNPLETVPNWEEQSSWSADGRWLAYSNEKNTVIFEVPSFRVVRRLQGSYEFRGQWFHERDGAQFWHSFDMAGPPLKDGTWSSPAKTGMTRTFFDKELGQLTMSDDGMYRDVKLPKGTCGSCDEPENASLFIATDHYAVYDVQCDSPNHPPRGMHARGNRGYGSSSTLLVDLKSAEARVLAAPGYWEGTNKMLLSSDEERLFVIPEWWSSGIQVYATRTGEWLEEIMTKPLKHEGHHACADIDPSNDRLVVITDSDIRVVPFGGHTAKAANMPNFDSGNVCKVSVRDKFATVLTLDAAYRFGLPNLDSMQRIYFGMDNSTYVDSDFSTDGKLLLLKVDEGWDLLTIATFSRKRLLPRANSEAREDISFDPSSRWLSLRGHLFDTSNGERVRDLSPELVSH